MPLRFLTAGESHGPMLTAILEGLPADLPIDRAALDHAMARRQIGYGSGGRMRIERDAVTLTAGVMAGRTTGAPIAILLPNRDHASWADREIAPMTVPRPGHADLSATVKYGHRDLRLALERASARETAARVAVGALCAQFLGAFGITVGSYVTAIGKVSADLDDADLDDDDEVGGANTYAAGGQDDRALAPDYPARFALAEASDLRCPDPASAERMRAAIEAAIRAKDTLGGVFEVVALGVPPGLGSHVHWDRRLGGRLAGALASIPAIKGVAIGAGFAAARRRGTEVHDRFALDAEGERIVRTSNRAGGLEGGITTGAPIVLSAAMKPISTTLTPLASVDLATGRPAETRYERSDFCAVPRAAVVAEAMVAYVLADALIEKLGGDSLAELRPRFAALAQGRIAELGMDDVGWRFGYEA